MAFARVRLSDLLAPPLATIFENSSQNSSDGSAFHLERPLMRTQSRTQSPLVTVPPLVHPPPDRPLPRVPRPENPHARPRVRAQTPIPVAPPTVRRRPHPMPNFSRPLPPKPPPRDRDYTDTFTAWVRYADKTEPLSQSGALRAYHEDMLTRPPGYNPEHHADCVERTKEWFATLYWRWQRIKASGNSTRQEDLRHAQTDATKRRCDTPWASQPQSQQFDFWL